MAAVEESRSCIVPGFISTSVSADIHTNTTHTTQPLHTHTGRLPLPIRLLFPSHSSLHIWRGSMNPLADMKCNLLSTSSFSFISKDIYTHSHSLSHTHTHFVSMMFSNNST